MIVNVLSSVQKGQDQALRAQEPNEKAAVVDGPIFHRSECSIDRIVSHSITTGMRMTEAPLAQAIHTG